MRRRLLLLFLLVSSFAFGQNNIYRSGGITQTVGAPTFTPGASGNIVAIDTVTGEWYVNPNRLSGASWISAGYRLTNISGSVPPAYTPTAHQSHFVVNAANQLYYWNGSSWQSVGGGGGGSTDALRLKFIVVNKSGGTLNKGEVVYVSGAQGNRVAVKKALASADSLSANTLGVMDETVADNGEGYCIAEGLVSGINTSAFTEGAALYLSPTTAGAITQTKPTAPDHLVLIGYCVKSNAGSGEISVHIQNGYELGELHDVYVPAPSNGQVLTYNTTNTRWEAATVADQSATNELQTIDTFSLSGQTLSASMSNDAQAAKTVTLPIIDVVAGTNVTVTKSNGVATVSATGGGGLSGVTGYVSQFNSSTTIDTTGLFWNGRLGINTASPSARLDIVGEGITSGTNAIKVSNSSRELMNIANNGAITIGKNDVTTTQNTSSIASDGADANIGIAIVPKGTGAITADIPDGGATGGNTRGNNAVDLQMSRTSATHVASGNLSVICGGANNSAQSTNAIVLGGSGNISSGARSITGGESCTASSSNAIALGSKCSASNTTSIAIGYSNASPGSNTLATGFNARSYLLSMRSHSGGNFSATENASGAAQRSDVGAYRSITGTSSAELTLDGGTPSAGNRLILALPTGATNGRLWNAIVQLSAICTTAGGTITVGESFIGTYNIGIKRIGANTSLVGTVQNMITAQADTNMGSSVVTITADDINESLQIEFTPPSGANASTVIRVVATVYLTEVGY